MYVGLIFSVPAVTFDLDSFGFEVPICGSSAKHNAASKKAKRQNQSSRFYFHEADRIWILFSVNISLFADEQSGLLTRIAMILALSVSLAILQIGHIYVRSVFTCVLADSGINLFFMKRLILFFIASAAFAYGLFGG